MENMEHSDKFAKFTKEAKQALIIAQEKAKEANLDYVGTEHILLGILTQSNSLGAHILFNFGVSQENVNLVLKTVGRLATKDTEGKIQGPAKAGLSGFAKKVIEEALKTGESYNPFVYRNRTLIICSCYAGKYSCNSYS
jgi:ATP-dependent Clp protease ATP-binding subunit ClpC